MMPQLQNLKLLLSNSRSRVVLMLTMLTLVVAAVVGVSIFGRKEGDASASLQQVPAGIKSVVGGFNRPETPQYAKLQEEQNTQNAQQALATGGTAIPTIISAQGFSSPSTSNTTANVCSCPTASDESVPGGKFVRQPIGTVCSDGTVRDEQGRIIGKTGLVVPGGVVYGPNGQVIGTVGPDGKVRDANGNLIGTVGPDGTVRDVNGNVIGSTTTPAEDAGKLVYDKNGHLIGVVGADGKVRDASGKVIGTVGANGEVKSLDGKVLGGVSENTPSAGSLVYDKNGHLIGVVGPDGKVRDASGKIVGAVGPDGTVRDAKGDVIGQAATSGVKEGTPIYDKNGKLIGTVGADGKVRDADGNTIGTVGPDGTVRDAAGNIIGQAAASGAPKTGSLVYDKNGRVIGTVGPDGKVRDANGNVIGTVGADGVVRDAHGNIIGQAATGSLPKAGSLVYDKNGRVIGTVGADGKVRDANGNVIGTVGPDGVVRDANGNVIGQATTPAPGTAVYDAQGRLIGTVGPDGKVRDASGNIIGTVGPDGVVRDASGKPVGKASYIAPGSAVFGPDGKLLGTVGPDGRLIPSPNANIGGLGGQAGGANGSVPSIASQTESRQDAAVRQQNAYMNQQKLQQMQAQFQGAMAGQAGQLFTAWAAPSQHYEAGDKGSAEGGSAGGGVGATGGNAVGDKGGAPGSTPAAVKAGAIMFAILDTAVNSDEPGPILATITDGKLRGGKLIGSLTRQDQKVMLTFTTLNLPDAPSSISVSAVAIDPNTARTALSSDTDNHYLLRYGTLFASSFISGYGQAVSQAGSSTTYTTFGVTHTIPPLNAQQKIMVALGNTGSNYGSMLGSVVNTPPTVKVYSGTGLGVLFLSDVAQLPTASPEGNK